MYDSADAAEAAFYRAFELADADAMMAVWAGDDVGVECVHPMGDRLVTRQQVEASWRGIFSGGPGLKFQINDVRRFDSEQVAVRIVNEDIRYGPDASQRSRIIATNVYHRTETGWLMVSHHGSPGTAPEPEMSSGPMTPSGPLH